MTSQSSQRAVLHVVTSSKKHSTLNYSRRMYAILRRYTPEVAEGGVNECFAELTGLRTFFKMSYKELAEKIKEDVCKEIGVICTVRFTKAEVFDFAKKTSKKSKSISTYKEINTLLAGASFVAVKDRKVLRQKRVRLVVPFIGKVV